MTERIEDPINGVLDETADPILRHNPEAVEISPLVSAFLEDSDRIDEQEEEEPQYEEDSVNKEEQTEQREHKEDSDDKENATEGSEDSDKDDKPSNDEKKKAHDKGPGKSKNSNENTPEGTPEDPVDDAVESTDDTSDDEDKDDDEPDNPPEDSEEPEDSEDPQEPQDPEEPQTPQDPQEPQTPQQPEDPKDPEEPKDPQTPQSPAPPETQKPGTNGGKNDGKSKGGPGGDGKRYDGRGPDAELPEAGSLAAPGQYATIVQMLAGKGGLKATSSSWVDEMKERGAFSDPEKDGIDDIATPWTGDSEKGYKLDVDALIEAAPDAVLVDNSDVVLSESDIKRLNEAKIDTVTVPTLGAIDTPDENITAAVAIVGQCLSTAETHFDTSSQVTLYNEKHDEALGNCLNANGGYSYKALGQSSYAGIYQGDSQTGMETTNLSSTRFATAFVDSVTKKLNSVAEADRTYSSEQLEFLNGETVSASKGIGLSMSSSSDNFALIDYYLQVSGVMDNSFDGVKPGENPAIILPGYAKNLIPSSLIGKFAIRNAYSALWFKMNDTQWVTVGDQAFPGILVRDAEMADAIAESGSDPKGIYNVGKGYFVRVVPSGLAGSWADGTVESFLLAPWAYGLFQLGDAAGTCDSYADGFYEAFYRISDASGAIGDYDASYTAGEETD